METSLSDKIKYIGNPPNTREKAILNYSLHNWHYVTDYFIK